MKVNEIFYSIQGEGAHTGEPAIFVRFAGCNLRCPFCDTNHQVRIEMSEDAIINEIVKYPASLVVFTGGEPSIQLTESLVNRVHENGKIVAIETNGTHQLPKGIDWVTVSPKEPFVKQGGKVVLTKVNEVKVVFDGRTLLADPTWGIKAEHYYMQPCDTGNKERNQEIINQVIQFVKVNSKWKISLQTQKILNVR